MAVDKKGTKQIAANKKAWHDYFVEEKYEAGIELAGTEVKSIRLGQINLKDSYCSFKDGEIFVRGMHISPYEKGNIFNKDPLRVRKLLMHKREIVNLFSKTKRVIVNQKMEKPRAESFSILNFPFSISKWGRNGFDGGVEAGIAGRSGDLR